MGRKTVRMNISVPTDLKREMEELKTKGFDINWSKIATTAFRQMMFKIKTGKNFPTSAEQRITELELKLAQLENK